VSALLALAPMECAPMAAAERSSRHDGGASFQHEIEHAKRDDDRHKPAPAKKEAPRKRSSDDERAAPADAQATPAAEPKQELSIAAEPIAIKVGGPALDAVIAQATTDAVKEAATTSVGDPVTEAAAQVALTPLEQAVHDLIDQLRDGHDDAGSHGGEAVAHQPTPLAQVSLAPLEDRETTATEPVVPVREPTTEQAAAMNPSHVHLVIDDGERIVVTVAVRGDNVIAHVRGGDESTASALARNAGSLENAMRARGLQLTDFQTSRDEPQRQREAPAEKRDDKSQPVFSLEEQS